MGRLQRLSSRPGLYKQVAAAKLYKGRLHRLGSRRGLYKQAAAAQLYICGQTVLTWLRMRFCISRSQRRGSVWADCTDLAPYTACVSRQQRRSSASTGLASDAALRTHATSCVLPDTVACFPTLVFLLPPGRVPFVCSRRVPFVSSRPVPFVCSPFFRRSLQWRTSLSALLAPPSPPDPPRSHHRHRWR